MITEISLRDHDCYDLTVKYAKMSTQHTFIQIIGRGENDYVTYNEIFTYNKKSNQFRVVKSFNDRSSYAEEIVTANDQDKCMLFAHFCIFYSKIITVVTAERYLCDSFSI